MSKESVLYAIITIIELVGAALKQLALGLILLIQTIFVDYWHYMLLLVFLVPVVWLCWLLFRVLAVIWQWVEMLLFLLLYAVWHYGGRLVRGAGIFTGGCLLAAWLPVLGLTRTGFHRPLLAGLIVGILGFIGGGLTLSWLDDPAGLRRIIEESRRYGPEAIFDLVMAIEPLRDSLSFAIYWTSAMMIAGYATGMAVAGHTAWTVFHERRQAKAFLKNEGVSASHKLAPDR